MTQKDINKLTKEKIEYLIEELIKDNKQEKVSGEFCKNPESTKATCDSAFSTNRISEYDYKCYIKILNQLKIYRNLQKQNQNRREAMQEYIDSLVFWN